MRLSRNSLIGVALAVASFMIPAAAHAAVAPALVAPAPDAADFVQGKSMQFDWNGALGGDPTAIGRAFFKLEIARPADVPTGIQSVWPTLEVVESTAIGSAETSIRLGVPSAGSWVWRVCAWGVVNVEAANVVQQLPGGCSASRAFTTAAVAAAPRSIGRVLVERQVLAPGRVVRVDRPRAAVDPLPPMEAVIDEPTVEKPRVVVPAAPEPTKYQELAEATVSGASASAFDGRAPDLKASAASERTGISGYIATQLTRPVPVLPIPFWVLALLLSCLPIAASWRRDMVGMFDWPDGSIDGSGDYGQMAGKLQSVQAAQRLKDGSTAADADATAGSSTSEEPERRRRAA